MDVSGTEPFGGEIEHWLSTLSPWRDEDDAMATCWRCGQLARIIEYRSDDKQSNLNCESFNIK